MTKRPYILVTNDDGIFAPGIKHLWEALIPFADVTVVAPANEQSGVGCSLTIRRPLHIQSIPWHNGHYAWKVDGTPVDCVKMAINTVMDRLPDLICSGINLGANHGRNFLFSGTVGAAIEGCMRGIPAVAFSAYNMSEPNFEGAAAYVPDIVKHLLESPLKPHTLLNVNFPDCASSDIQGLKLTRHGRQYWIENLAKRQHPAHDHTYYWMGCKLIEMDEHDDCDVKWMEKGYIAAVPIELHDLTHYEEIKQRKQSFEQLFDKVAQPAG